MRILITGSAGMIGSALAYLLHQKGHELILIDNLSHGYLSNLIYKGKILGEFHALDVRSEKIEPLFEGVDYVFHMAAISSLPECQSNPGEAIDVNVAGTANVLEMARRNKVKRVIFASTSAIYENNTDFPCEEEDPVQPTLVYSMTKLMAEQLCKAYTVNYGLDVVITRYYNVYGPNQDIRRKSPPFVGYAIREALAKRVPLFHSDGRQKRDYVYIDDVNKLNLLCMTHPKAPGQIFNACSAKAYSVKDIYGIIQKLVKGAPEPAYRESSKLWDKYPELKKGLELKDEVVENEVNKFTLGSPDKAAKILGWKASISMEEGLRKTITYFKAKKLVS